ncbi:MAG: hypothetical protein KatS3mg012_1392 [Gaiellaceae bacterium]|nr:MAG: hypothetical protein KatS3mg012_1392 [Gaiellaceae bacterium]
MTPDELRAIPLFSRASYESLERLAQRGGELECEAGQLLALHGDRGSGMFVVLEGNVSVEWPGGAVELGPGAFVGELTVLVPDVRRVARVRAATPVRCLAIAREDATELIESEPTVALAMLRELARRLATTLPGD